MDRLPSAVIVFGILLIALALMWWGWRARVGRQAGLPTLPPVPADAGAEVFATGAFYVATTEHGKPLERIAVGGLGFRARSQLSAREQGISLTIPGQEALFIPFASLRSVFRASHTIDRAVERDGLIVLEHDLGAAAGDSATVDTYLRIVDPSAATRFVDEVSSRALGTASQ